MTESSISSLPCLIDDILPTHNVHLIGGVSDAGKTRFILPTLLEWEKGKAVMGRSSHPVPWVYIIGDRAKHEAERSMTSMEIDPRSVRTIPAFGKHNKNLGLIMGEIKKMSPAPQLVIWEGFQDFPVSDHKKDVREFLSHMTAYCEDDNLTILGIVESPKLKPTEKYKNPRQRVSGVSSWGFHTSTIIMIEGVEGDDELKSEHRVIWVCMKNSPRRELAGKFDEKGRLKYVDGPVMKFKVKRTEALKLTFG